MRFKVKDNKSLEETLAVNKQSNGAFIKFAITVLFRRKWMILLLFISLAAMTATIAVMTPDRYRSTMKILVKNERVDAAVSADEHTWKDVRQVSEEAINSEIEIIKSRDLIQLVAEKIYQAQQGETTNKKPGTVENEAENIQGNLEVNPVKKSEVIEVTYNDKSAEKTVAVLKELANGYLDKHLKAHHTPGTHEFFKSQTEIYEKELKQVQMDTTIFRKKYEVADLETQKKLNLNYQADMEKFMFRAEADVRDAEQKVLDFRRQLSTMPKRITTQQREIPNQFSIERMNTMIVDLNHRKTQLLTKFNDDDRLVQEVDKQIADTKIALEKAEKFKAYESQTDPNPVRMSLEPELAKTEAALAGFRAQREIMAKQLQGYRQRQLELESATSQYNNLDRSLRQAEENYKLYAKKEEEARIANALDQQKISNVTIAEMPTKPVSPFKPNRPMTMIIGLLMSFFVSLSIAFLMEYFTNTISSAEDFSDLENVADLGSIPKAKQYKNMEMYLVSPINLMKNAKSSD